MKQQLYKKAVKTFRNTKLVKVGWIRKFNNKLRGKLKPEFIITKENNKIFLDENDDLHLSIYDNWERESLEIETIKKIVSEGDTVIDIGANIGFYTLILAQIVGEKGRVYAVEPHPISVSLLRKNIEANNYMNVTIIEKAFSNEIKEGILYLNNQLSASSLGELDETYNKSIQIGIDTLDNFFEDIKINFIKIDVEGFEGNVIEGGKEIIENNDLKIITEINPPALESSGYGQENYLKLLKQMGFNLNYIDEDNNKLIPIEVNQLINLNPYVKNVLCKKSDIK